MSETGPDSPTPCLSKESPGQEKAHRDFFAAASSRGTAWSHMAFVFTEVWAVRQMPEARLPTGQQRLQLLLTHTLCLHAWQHPMTSGCRNNFSDENGARVMCLQAPVMVSTCCNSCRAHGHSSGPGRAAMVSAPAPASGRRP
jgi:hypothetical protein